MPDRIDPATLMRLGSLELRARAVVEGFLSGLHRSPYHGFSAEFSEYRQYVPGDDVRYLDWRLYGRSDRYFIKRFEDETNLACWLLVDLSRSMAYTSDQSRMTKADFARTAAATLAYFLTRQRDAVGLLTFDQQIGQIVPARFRPGHLHQVFGALETAEGGESTDVLGPLDRVAATVRKRGLVVLLTDLLAPLDGLSRSLSYLRARGHEVLVLRTLDPREIDFAFDEATMFRDRESGRSIFVDPAEAAAKYRANFEEHARGLEQMTRSHGIDLATLRTDESLDRALFELLAARARRAAVGMRRPSSGAVR